MVKLAVPRRVGRLHAAQVVLVLDALASTSSTGPARRRATRRPRRRPSRQSRSRQSRTVRLTVSGMPAAVVVEVPNDALMSCAHDARVVEDVGTVAAVTRVGPGRLVGHHGVDGGRRAGCRAPRRVAPGSRRWSRPTSRRRTSPALDAPSAQPTRASSPAPESSPSAERGPGGCGRRTRGRGRGPGAPPARRARGGRGGVGRSACVVGVPLRRLGGAKGLCRPGDPSLAERGPPAHGLCTARSARVGARARPVRAARSSCPARLWSRRL